MTPTAKQLAEMPERGACGPSTVAAATAANAPTITTPTAGSTAARSANTAATKSAGKPGASRCHAISGETSLLHSHSTSAAAIAQTMAKAQPPRNAARIVTG